MPPDEISDLDHLIEENILDLLANINLLQALPCLYLDADVDRIRNTSYIEHLRYQNGGRVYEVFDEEQIEIIKLYLEGESNEAIHDKTACPREKIIQTLSYGIDNINPDWYPDYISVQSIHELQADEHHQQLP